MKKKILIVSSSLATGGLEKCLINLCDNFDYEKYDVDLYLFNEGRDLLPKLNKNVNLLPDSPFYADVYNRSFGSSVKTLLKKGKYGLTLYRVGRFVRIRLGSKKFTAGDWNNMKKTMLKLDKHYDVAIGFEEGSACYYVADCVSADVKLGWIHTDIKKINNNKKLDESAFEKLDSVITVSQNSLRNLKEVYPAFENKFKCIILPSLLNYDEVNRLAQEPNKMSGDEIKILSVGRLVELKGFHLCVEPCKRLIDEGYKIKWYVAGEGDYRAEIEAEIEKYDLKDHFILLGNCANPYTYMNSADICVQPSSYEGYSVAVFEEKYFKKAVVVTNIPSNFEMITDKKNGVIIERTPDDIYRGVKYFLDDPDARLQMGQAPVNGLSNNRQIIEEIEKCFEK
ncbi:MAG: glycosyltransferase [Ruminococcaceae bacterium]|nr:glycosyltransferase [Oscillospiraceae bacterium]MBE6707199.1 glycosyltransferase [Oscillospiraceae bacterium]